MLDLRYAWRQTKPSQLLWQTELYAGDDNDDDFNTNFLGAEAAI